MYMQPYMECFSCVYASILHSCITIHGTQKIKYEEINEVLCSPEFATIPLGIIYLPMAKTPITET